MQADRIKPHEPEENQEKNRRETGSDRGMSWAHEWKELGAAYIHAKWVLVGVEPSLGTSQAASLPSDHKVTCVLEKIYYILDRFEPVV